MTVNFGIVGFGFMGQVHLNMLSSIEGVHILGICDVNPDRLVEVPSHIATYSSIDEMVKDTAIDVILIAANNDQHRLITEVAAKAGKHILCEKPVALTIEDLDEMEKVCADNSVSFAVHQQRRFDEDYRVAKEVYETNSLGEVYTIKSMLYGFNGSMHDWHVFKDQGGGMLYDWGVHLIDQILWMIPGKIKSVYADLRNVINAEVDDYFHIILAFENNIVAQIELGTYFLRDSENWFERHWFIGGNKGSMYIDGFKPKGKIVRTSELLQSVPGQITITAAGPTRSFGPPPPGRLVTEKLPNVDVNHRMYFDNYLAALRGEEYFLIKIDEVRRVLQVMDAVRQSATTGHSVAFES